MIYDADIHHRRSIRLQGYDYSQAGAYFITICTQNRERLFGDIVVVGAGPCACPGMVLNDAGKMIQTIWNEIPINYAGTEIDEFIVMPNHIHGIVRMVGATPRGCPGNWNGERVPKNGQAQGPVTRGQAQGPAPTMSLGDIVHRFKTMTTKRYIDGVKQSDWQPFPGRLWQRNYWEHIVGNDAELNRIREYIQNNPAQWQFDRLNLRIGGPLRSDVVRQPSGAYTAERWMV